jgi:tetratricopeptide (TPR) repeat protein
MAMIHKIMLILLFLGFTSGCATVSEMLPWKKGQTEKKQLVEMYLNMGQDSEQNGDLKEAMKHYKSALVEDPENQEALQDKNRVEGKMQAAAERHYQIGMNYHRAGKYDVAHRQFRTALHHWPDHEQAKKMLDTRREIIAKGYVLHTIKPGESLSMLAKIYYGDYHQFPIIAEFNNFTDATKVNIGQIVKVPKIEGLPFFEKKQERVKKKEAKPTTVDQLSEETAKKAKNQEAALAPEKETKQVETKDDKIDDGQKAPDDNVAMYRNLGVDLYNKKKYKEAIFELNKVIKVDPNDKTALEYLGKSYFQRGMDLFNQEDYLPAKKAFEAGFKYWGNCEKCMEYAQKSEAIYKDIHYNKGISYFNNEDLSGAIAEWELVMAVDRHYKDVEYHITKAKALLEKLEAIRKEQ